MDHRIDQKAAAPPQARRYVARAAAARSRDGFARASGRRHGAVAIAEHRDHRAPERGEHLRGEGRRS